MNQVVINQKKHIIQQYLNSFQHNIKNNDINKMNQYNSCPTVYQNLSSEGIQNSLLNRQQSNRFIHSQLDHHDLYNYQDQNIKYPNGANQNHLTQMYQKEPLGLQNKSNQTQYYYNQLQQNQSRIQYQNQLNNKYQNDQQQQRYYRQSNMNGSLDASSNVNQQTMSNSNNQNMINWNGVNPNISYNSYQQNGLTQNSSVCKQKEMGLVKMYANKESFNNMSYYQKATDDDTSSTNNNKVPDLQIKVKNEYEQKFYDNMTNLKEEIMVDNQPNSEEDEYMKQKDHQNKISIQQMQQMQYLQYQNICRLSNLQIMMNLRQQIMSQMNPINNLNMINQVGIKPEVTELNSSEMYQLFKNNNFIPQIPSQQTLAQPSLVDQSNIPQSSKQSLEKKEPPLTTKLENIKKMNKNSEQVTRENKIVQKNNQLKKCNRCHKNTRKNKIYRKQYYCIKCQKFMVQQKRNRKLLKKQRLQRKIMKTKQVQQEKKMRLEYCQQLLDMQKIQQTSQFSQRELSLMYRNAKKDIILQNKKGIQNIENLDQKTDLLTSKHSQVEVPEQVQAYALQQTSKELDPLDKYKKSRVTKKNNGIQKADSSRYQKIIDLIKEHHNYTINDAQLYQITKFFDFDLQHLFQSIVNDQNFLQILES